MLEIVSRWVDEKRFLGLSNPFYVEESMNASIRKIIWFGLTILAFGCIVAVVRAQEKNEAPGTGSLAALTTEVRQLDSGPSI
jgi:hypothetical protein